MSYTNAKDISRWQGNWQETGESIVLIKIGGGDNGLYFDDKSAEDWARAVADGRAVGGYWYAGWTNPAAEAAYFLKGMLPLVENDVYDLDCEAIPAGFNPVVWAKAFRDYIHDQNGVWCLMYMNLATLNAYDWTSVLDKSGLHLADWNDNPEGTIPTQYTYVMQQYSDGPSYDHDAWFGTVEEFKQYGYHAPQPVISAPVPDPTPPPTPVLPTETPAPADPPSAPTPPADTPPAPPVAPESEPTAEPVVEPTPEPVSEPMQYTWYERLLNAFGAFFATLRNKL